MVGEPGAKRQGDVSFTLGDMTFQECCIPFPDGLPEELFLQVFVSIFIFGDNQQAGCCHVQPVYEEWSRCFREVLTNHVIN